MQIYLDTSSIQKSRLLNKKKKKKKSETKHDSSKCIVLWVVTQEGEGLRLTMGLKTCHTTTGTRQESADLISVSIVLKVETLINWRKKKNLITIS